MSPGRFGAASTPRDVRPLRRWPGSPSVGPCLLLLLVLGGARTLRSVGSPAGAKRKAAGVLVPDGSLRRILVDQWVWSVFRNSS